jgi:hypothetical protein
MCSTHTLKIPFALLVISAVLNLAGCAPIQSHDVNPKSLSLPKTDKNIVLTEAYTWVISRKGEHELKYVLSPGAYIPELSSADGTYYRGPEKCVAVVSGTPKDALAFLREGGIFVNSQGELHPIIYLYRSSDHTTVKYSESTSESTTAKHTKSLSHTVQNIASPTTESPKESLTRGVGSGIGAAIVQAAIRANDSMIMVPHNQPVDESLYSLIQF